MSAIGCIGCGFMGGALLAGLAAHTQDRLYGYNRTPQRLDALKAKGVTPCATPLELARTCDVILIGLKPYLVENALNEITPALNSDKVVISIAAGVSLSALHDAVDGACPVVRVMPNTPAVVGAGVFALCLDDPGLTSAHKERIRQLFTALGEPVELKERYFTAFTALIGGGPAYVFQFMEAMVQASVTLGFSHAGSRRMVQQLFAGAARMAAASELSLADLRNQVCSPGGLTIEAVNALDRSAVTAHIIDAILAADKKGHELEE